MAEDGDHSAGIIEAATNFVEANRRDSAALVSAAYSLYVASRTDLADIAESMAKEALRSKGEESMDASYLLARIYLDRGDIVSASQFVRIIVDSAHEDSVAVDRVITFAIRAAGMGFANEMLSLIRDSPSRTSLEPLDVALSRMTGDKALAPKELSDVADDIVQKIDQQRKAIGRRKWLQ
jgi:hypothetical protein